MSLWVTVIAWGLCLVLLLGSLRLPLGRGRKIAYQASYFLFFLIPFRYIAADLGMPKTPLVIWLAVEVWLTITYVIGCAIILWDERRISVTV